MRRSFLVAVIGAVCSLSIAVADIRMVTLPSGEQGFFMERDDVEECVMSMENEKILEKRVESLEKVCEDVSREAAARKNEADCWMISTVVFIGTTIVGTLVGYFVGVFVK